ncbi:EAL domain-containing protein [Methylobacterium oryzisoli]|uniref:EAL domain-containing protein n=1 Tax=Methylobacterium oryzisoli TaxID=3385502 RepID=UPI003891D540
MDPLHEGAVAAKLALAKIRQGLCVFDREQRLVLFNDRFATMYDLLPNALRIGMSFREVIDLRYAVGTGPEMPADEYAAWRRQINIADRVVETTVTLRDGRVYEIHHEPTPEGGWVATHDDITERVLARADLAESEARYRALAEMLPHMVWIMRDGDGEAVYVNHQFHDYFGPIGLSRAARIATNHPKDAFRIAQAWQEVISSGGHGSVEGRLRRRDGTYRWHRLTAVPLRRDGEITAWLGTALDIDDLVRTQQDLREKTDLLQVAQEAAGAGLFDWNVADGQVLLSPESLRLFNLPQDGARTIGMAECFEIFHPGDLQGLWQEARRAVASGTTYRAEFRVSRPGEPDRWILGTGRVINTAGSRSTRIVGLNFDISERKHAEEILRSSEERLAHALDAGSDGLWDCNLITGRTWYSDRWQTMLGYAPGEVEEHMRAWECLLHPDDKGKALRLLADHVQGRAPAYECEYRLRTRGGDYTWVLSRAKVVAHHASGAALRLVGTHLDINARKMAEQQIAHMARHDALTDLPNRLLLRERLEQRLAEVRHHGGQCGLLYLDLDRFKSINDTLGHSMGDALLREVARRFQSALRVEDMAARLGGDEFVIVINGAGREECAALAERLIVAMREPVWLGERPLEVGVSVGIALAPTHGLDTDTLLKRADQALYRAKHEGRNTYRLFEPAMDETAEERRRLELDLRLALRRGEFEMHYQPIVEAASGTVVAYEALVRWRHPVRGLVSPGEFIPLAEETGLIVPLGEWVLRAATHDAQRFPSQVRIAVNISAVQARHANLLRTVQAALSASRLPPGRLELEITEGVLLDEGDGVRDLLRGLRGLGVRLALDDFGTGYSSLSYLRRFPFDKIKIDRTFMADFDNPETAAIVRAIVGLGISLGMVITAEGIETPGQLAFAEAQGCVEVQGYVLGRPQPVEAALAAGCHTNIRCQVQDHDLRMRTYR